MIDINELRKKLQEIKGQRGGNQDFLQKYWVAPEYDSTMPQRSIIRILPGKENKFYSETRIHRINGKNIHCPKLINKPCPLCEYINHLWKTEDPENIKIAREIKQTKRFYMNVISRERVVLNPEKSTEELKINDGPLIFSCGVKLIEKIFKTILDPEYGDITDIANGYDYKIIKETRHDYPVYDDSKPAKNSSRAGNIEEIKIWLENQHDLESLITILSYDELKQELDTFRGINNNPATSSDEENTNDLPVVTTKEVEESEESTDDNDDFLAQLRKIQNNG